MAGALAGLRVIDLSGHLSGPFCAMQLADMGADVIKVEKPEGGDEARRMPPFVNGEGAPFMVWNRNKRSVTLDLKSDDGRAKFLALVETADIVLENFRPGTMDKLGLGYDTLKVRFPRLIYCAISGFGQTGPERAKGGFDLMTQAMSGLMAVCGPADGPPHRLPIAISDVGAGLYAAIGILSALEARHRTGRGQYVETSLFEAAMSLGVYEAAHYFTTDQAPPRIGQAHRGSSPYQVFKAADGYMTFGASQQNFWTKLCAIVGAPELERDPRFSTNAERVKNNDSLVALLQAKLETQPRAHWLDALAKAGIPAAPVLTHDQVFTHPQTIAREMVVPVQHAKAGASRTLGVAVKLSDTPGAVTRAAPVLGQHNDEVFAELAARPKRALAGED
jgi:crotonobetainyl-CoA:carnitine CoA-transferase CaiB-like acyl-CoA transferase